MNTSQNVWIFVCTIINHFNSNLFPNLWNDQSTTIFPVISVFVSVKFDRSAFHLRNSLFMREFFQLWHFVETLLFTNFAIEKRKTYVRIGQTIWTFTGIFCKTSTYGIVCFQFDWIKTEKLPNNHNLKNNKMFDWTFD